MRLTVNCFFKNHKMMPLLAFSAGAAATLDGCALVGVFVIMTICLIQWLDLTWGKAFFLICIDLFFMGLISVSVTLTPYAALALPWVAITLPLFATTHLVGAATGNRARAWIIGVPLIAMVLYLIKYFFP